MSKQGFNSEKEFWQVAAKEMRRVLKDNGRVTISVGVGIGSESGIKKVLVNEGFIPVMQYQNIMMFVNSKSGNIGNDQMKQFSIPLGSRHPTFVR